MPEKSGVGLLSLAHAHVGIYADEIAKMTDARVAAVWDEDPARGTAKAKALGADFVGDLHSFLSYPGMDGVIIGSETSKHTEHVLAAAEAGKPVLLQKPMATRIEDCDKILEGIKKTKTPFSMAWQMRCDPQNQWIRRTVQAGEFGRIGMVRRRHGLSTQLWPGFEKSWHVNPKLNVGMFFDDAAHPLDWMVWTFGRPRAVSAEIRTVLNKNIPDDNGAALFSYDGGMTVVIECSFTCVAADDTTNIYGEKGTILQRWGDATSTTPGADPRGLRFKRAGESGWSEVDIPSPPAHGERIKAVARPGVEFLMGQRPALATAAEGRENVELLLACYKSSKEGRRVEL